MPPSLYIIYVIENHDHIQIFPGNPLSAFTFCHRLRLCLLLRGRLVPLVMSHVSQISKTVIACEVKTEIKSENKKGEFPSWHFTPTHLDNPSDGLNNLWHIVHVKKNYIPLIAAAAVCVLVRAMLFNMEEPEHVRNKLTWLKDGEWMICPELRNESKRGWSRKEASGGLT